MDKVVNVKTRDKILIIASNPSKSSRGRKSSTFNNLCNWINIPIFSFTNVSCINTPNNRPLKKSEYQLKRLCTECQNYDKILALGNTASDALNRLNIDHFKLPHPSGLNRKLNDKEYLTRILNDANLYCSR